MQSPHYTTPPELMPGAFVFGSAGFHRIRKDGSHKAIRTLNGGRLMTTYGQERIYAIDIVWCLHYGNWPKYPLISLDKNPHQLHIAKIFPARLRTLRYRPTKKGDLFFHPLSDVGYRSSSSCRISWQECAAEYYQQDLAFVLAEEAHERSLRAATLRLLPPEPVKPPKPPKVYTIAEKVPSRPAPVAGRVWHYYRKAWLSVPAPVHLADDYRTRCLAVLVGGCTEFKFDPVSQQVLAYLPDGRQWQRPEGERP